MVSWGEVLCVAASDDTDQFTFFSNYGLNSVELVAPGQNVLSALESKLLKLNLGRNHRKRHGNSGLTSVFEGFLRFRSFEAHIWGTRSTRRSRARPSAPPWQLGVPFGPRAHLLDDVVESMRLEGKSSLKL